MGCMAEAVRRAVRQRTAPPYRTSAPAACVDPTVSMPPASCAMIERCPSHVIPDSHAHVQCQQRRRQEAAPRPARKRPIRLQPLPAARRREPPAPPALRPLQVRPQRAKLIRARCSRHRRMAVAHSLAGRLPPPNRRVRAGGAVRRQGWIVGFGTDDSLVLDAVVVQPKTAANIVQQAWAPDPSLGVSVH